MYIFWRLIYFTTVVFYVILNIKYLIIDDFIFLANKIDKNNIGKTLLNYNKSQNEIFSISRVKL